MPGTDTVGGDGGMTSVGEQAEAGGAAAAHAGQQATRFGGQGGQRLIDFRTETPGRGFEVAGPRRQHARRLGAVHFVPAEKGGCRACAAVRAPVEQTGTAPSAPRQPQR